MGYTVLSVFENNIKDRAIKGAWTNKSVQHVAYLLTFSVLNWGHTDLEHIHYITGHYWINTVHLSGHGLRSLPIALNIGLFGCNQLYLLWCMAWHRMDVVNISSADALVTYKYCNVSMHLPLSTVYCIRYLAIMCSWDWRCEFDIQYSLTIEYMVHTLLFGKRKVITHKNWV